MRISILIVFVSLFAVSCAPETVEPGWYTDFFDDFDTFDTENWQDQILWVNNEDQCYVRDGAYGTREVSDGSIKLKVVNVGEVMECDNMSKFGEQHPPTQYMAGRIASKNRQEFVKGRWTARLKLSGSGEDGMFPAWWLLGAQNNEPPVQEPDETVCWPITGSGEIDIFEHHGASGKDHYVARAIKALGGCEDGGDWWTYQLGLDSALEEFHEYGVEWSDGHLVYQIDGVEAARNDSLGVLYPEPLFAILNFAKITDAPMTGEWVMEVDWVRHESWRSE